MPELSRGIYKILSVAAEGNPLTGVGPQRPPSLPVHVDAAVHLWEVKPQDKPDFYRLSLVDAYPYIGMKDRSVIATLENRCGIDWYITYHKEHEAFTIAAISVWPAPAWTLVPNGSGAKIGINLFDVTPAKSQLFTFEWARDSE